MLAQIREAIGATRSKGCRIKSSRGKELRDREREKERHRQTKQIDQIRQSLLKGRKMCLRTVAAKHGAILTFSFAILLLLDGSNDNSNLVIIIITITTTTSNNSLESIRSRVSDH